MDVMMQVNYKNRGNEGGYIGLTANFPAKVSTSRWHHPMTW